MGKTRRFADPAASIRWNRLRLLLHLLVCALFIFALVGAECSSSSDRNDPSQNSDDDDDSNQEVDDCGFPIVTMPEGCDSCHGFPPQTSRHPQNNRCYRCHGYTVNSDFDFVQPELHKNGEVEKAVGCTSCHGWDEGTSPPQNLKGECTKGMAGIGNHAKMRRDAILAHRTSCSDCHHVPSEIWQEGHIDGDHKAEINFGNMATANGATPTYDNGTCSGVYCHGATLKGGDHKNPSWTDTSGQAKKCGACHLIADPDGNKDADCSSCHPQTLDSARTILPQGTHINGTIDIGAAK